MHRRLTEATEEWERLGRDEGILYRGARLAGAAEWRRSNDAPLNALEREFLDASLASEKRERAGRERIRRNATVAAAAAAATFLVLAVFAAFEWRAADEQREAALARQLAAQAGSPHTRTDKALLLSLEANEMSGAAEVRGSLLAALTNTRARIYLAHGEYDEVAVAYSPDGKTFASGAEDGTVVLWDVAKELRIGEPLRGHSARIESVAFSPDGKLLASGSDDHTIILWDVARRVAIGDPLRGHTDRVESVAFSHDGGTLASGSDDDTIVLWDVASRVAKGDRLPGHVVRVLTVAFSPDDKTLAWGGFDGNIVLRNVKSSAPCRRVDPRPPRPGRERGIQPGR